MTSKQQVPEGAGAGPFSEAEMAWRALAALMADTPLDVPAAWLTEVQVRWGAEQEHLILHVPSSTDPLWLKKKFLPVANVFYSQLQGGQGQLLVEYERGPDEDDLRLKAERGAYESIVRPEKVLPISVYMFQHWLPVLKPSAFWIALSMRQTAFVSKATTSQVGKRISVRDLARWIPLHYSNVSRTLSKKDFLSWFFTLTDEAYDDLAPEYSVYVQYPLAPHHIAWIDEFLQDRLAKGNGVEGALRSLLEHTQEVRRVRPGELAFPDDYLDGRCSLTDLAAAYQPGKIDSGIHDLCSQLTSEITRDYLTVSIPHYFLLGYREALSCNEAALIWLLRSLYYEHDDRRHTFESYSALADLVGLSYKTIKRMLARCPQKEKDDSPDFSPIFQSKNGLGNWLLVETLPDSSSQGREFSLRVRSSEPILPQHEAKYLSLIEKEVQQLNSQIATGGGQKATPSSRRDSQIATPPGQPATAAGQNTTGSGHAATEAGQDATPLPDRSQHLNSLSKESVNQQKNEHIKELLQPHQMDFWEIEENPDSGGKVVGVNITKLLGFDGYAQEEKEKLIPEINKNETHFLAWMMRNHLTHADFPARLAIRNMQENNTTESKYIDLAGKGWYRIHELLVDDLELLSEKEEHQEIIKNLRETNFPDVLEDILPAEKGEGKENDDPGEGEMKKKEPQEVEPVFRHGWEVVKGELQLEMKKSDFDTWVSSIRLVGVEQGKFIFETNNSYARDWLDQNLEEKLVNKLSPLVRGNRDQARVQFVSR